MYNTKRDFKRTSFVHTDDLYPWIETSMKKISNGVSIIIWPSCGWNYVNAMSCHNLNNALSMKVWLKLANFVLDGTNCATCLNGFGPERGFHLRSNEYIYHPIC